MKTIRKWIGLTMGLCLAAILVMGFAPDSSNFNNTQFLVTGTTISIAHLSAALVDSGTLNAGQFPALTGDITTPGGSLATTLKNTGTAGTYTKPTFDAQGRETSGTSAILASADYANQGTTTTLLHGNAAGNPSWTAVQNGDLANSSITINGASTSLGGTASSNGGILTNLNGGAITGGVWRIDVPGFALTPADSGSMSFVTNTPGSAQGGIQGSGPSRMMWQVTTSGTNVYANFPLPFNYDGGTVTAEAWFTGGTNSSTKTTNVVTMAASTFGSALGTAVTITNQVPTTTGFWTTNSQAVLTIGGSPGPGRSVTIQVSVNNSAPQFSITNLLCVHHFSLWGTATNVQQGNITMP